jgi:RimJ/RimL family protein N-acetyltransferase
MSIRLVPFADEHAADFALTILDPDILRFTGVPVPTPEGWVEVWRKLYDEHPDRENFAVIDDSVPEHNGFVGWACGFHRSVEDGSIELGYAVAPWSRGRGYGSAALRLLSEWGFGQGLQRLVLQIQVENLASQGVAKSAGYTYEGTQRSVHHKNGERVDLQLWSLLPTDPR